MKIRRKKFLIVGGASLVGSHIADQLLAGGAAEVRVFDNFSLGSQESVQHLKSDRRAKVIRGDVLRLNELLDAAEGIDGVFQVAAFLAQPIANSPWVGLDVNIRGVQNVLEACRIRGVKRVVYSSSVSVYGNAGASKLISEKTPFIMDGVNPVMMLYATSKLMGEQLCRFYAERYGIEFLSLRYSSVYGIRQHTHSINALHIVEMYESIRAGQRPVIVGDGKEVHDYIYVGDVARANLLAMESSVSGEAITIATGEARSLNDIVRHLIKLSGTKLKPKYVASSDRLTFTASSRLKYARDKAQRLLGWSPKVRLEEGISLFVEWRESCEKKARLTEAEASR